MTTATQERTSELVVADRCDTGDCQSQARVRVTFSNGPVDFCAHHFNAVEGLVQEQALDIDDQRASIT